MTLRKRWGGPAAVRTCFFKTKTKDFSRLTTLNNLKTKLVQEQDLLYLFEARHVFVCNKLDRQNRATFAHRRRTKQSDCVELRCNKVQVKLMIIV
jgi:hypothetical protein